jgi:hypothetical protein
MKLFLSLTILFTVGAYQEQKILELPCLLQLEKQQRNSFGAVCTPQSRVFSLRHASAHVFKKEHFVVHMWNFKKCTKVFYQTTMCSLLAEVLLQ